MSFVNVEIALKEIAEARKLITELPRDERRMEESSHRFLYGVASTIKTKGFVTRRQWDAIRDIRARLNRRLGTWNDPGAAGSRAMDEIVRLHILIDRAFSDLSEPRKDLAAKWREELSTMAATIRNTDNLGRKDLAYLQKVKFEFESWFGFPKTSKNF